MSPLFLFLSFVALLSALGVVLAKNPIHSILFLILTFFTLSGHYLLLNAQFLAAVNIIVYAGAIMVLFLFVIMFLNLNQDTEPQKPLLAKVDPNTAATLRTQINEARAEAGLPPLADAAPVADASPALLTVTVDLAPALKEKLAPMTRCSC